MEVDAFMLSCQHNVETLYCLNNIAITLVILYEFVVLLVVRKYYNSECCVMYDRLITVFKMFV
jgi:hypothetical protein